MNLENATGDQARQAKARLAHDALRDPDAVGVVTDKTVRVFIRHIPVALIEQAGDQALVAELNAASGGCVTRYTMFADKTGRFTGQAMCTFATAAGAASAIEALNNKGRANAGPGEEPVELELAKEHGVVLASRLHEMERDRKLTQQPWRHDRFGRGGGGGGYGAGRGGGGRGGRGGLPDMASLDAMLKSYAEEHDTS